MRLEPLCHISMRYEESSWHRPYRQHGDRGEGGEALGFGRGTGTVTGDVLGGQLVWANYPRRRENGVWTPNLRGFIRTGGGSELLLSVHGQSLDQDSPEPLRAILARLEFTTEDPAFTWLNTCLWSVRASSTGTPSSGGWMPSSASTNKPGMRRPSGLRHLPASGKGPGGIGDHLSCRRRPEDPSWRRHGSS
jgi:hypothetical protein